MMTLRTLFVFVFLALGLASGLRAAGEMPAPSEKIYVTIETFDPIKFHEFRQSRVASGELVFSTLTATAANSAKLAGLPAEIVVLDEGVAAPKDATVLRLTWTDGRSTVKADLTEKGKNHYFGVVSAQPISIHPEYARLRRAMELAPNREEANDAGIRSTTEAHLYFALKWVAERRARSKTG